LKILVATKNRHKLWEIQDILGCDTEVFSAFETLNINDDIDESGQTFEENAKIKALYISNFTKEYVLADDSGLEVFAINNAPGVHSARYAGIRATDLENNTKLLNEMEHIDDRRGRYVCVLALAKDGNIVSTFTGTLEGKIAYLPKGTNGFGYDPIFELEDGRTVAEVGPSEKNRISHRYRALVKLKEYLKNLRG
jgi:XTP/dITP diphosphohydrolase